MKALSERPPADRSNRWLRATGIKDVAILVAIFLSAVIVSPRTTRGEIIFVDPANLTDALRALVPVALMALAMTYVILTGGIDLSVGSTVALAGVVVARVLVEWQPAPSTGAHVAIAVFAAIATGGLVGLANGLLVAGLRIQPFIVTLASMIGIRGLALWLSNNERIGLGVGDDVRGWFGALLSGKLVMVATLAAFAVVFLVVLNRTVFGRQIVALGDNPVAASLAGLPVRGLQVAVYTSSGLMAGVAGVLLAARTTTGDPNAGLAMELDTIAVVVIGGASLSGGKGGILGTLNGALIIGMLTNILGLRNVDFNAQLMLKAIIIVVAVALQRRGSRA